MDSKSTGALVLKNNIIKNTDDDDGTKLTIETNPPRRRLKFSSGHPWADMMMMNKF